VVGKLPLAQVEGDRGTEAGLLAECQSDRHDEFSLPVAKLWWYGG